MACKRIGGWSIVVAIVFLAGDAAVALADTSTAVSTLLSKRRFLGKPPSGSIPPSTQPNPPGPPVTPSGGGNGSSGQGSGNGGSGTTAVNPYRMTAAPGNTLTGFGNVFSTQVRFARSYQGISTTVAFGDGILGSQVTLLEGKNPHWLPATVTMTWRARTDAEKAPTAQHPLLPSWAAYLASDVVKIEGVRGIYVLQMDYSPQVESLIDEISDSQKGRLFLGTLDGSGSSAQWVNAVDTNSREGNHNRVETNFHGSYDEFRQEHNSDSLNQLLGSWGVDIQHHTVWAVIDHTGQFAVVPEPGTLWLAAIAGLGLAAWVWRRRIIAGRDRTSAAA